MFSVCRVWVRLSWLVLAVVLGVLSRCVVLGRPGASMAVCGTSSVCSVRIVLLLTSVPLDPVTTIGLRIMGCVYWVSFLVMVMAVGRAFSTLTPIVCMLRLLSIVLTRVWTRVGDMSLIVVMWWAPRVATVASIDVLQIFSVEKAPRLVRTFVLLLSLDFVTASVTVTLPFYIGVVCA